MPVALDLDWSGIRAAAVALQNVQAAARQAAADLPPEERQRLIECINKRALREGWLEKAAAVQATHRAESGLSNAVQNGHQIVSNVMAEDSSQTKLALSKYALKVAQHAQALEPELAMNAAPLVHSSAKTAAIAHSWSDRANLSLNVSIYADRPQELPAEARVIEAEEVE